MRGPAFAFAMALALSACDRPPEPEPKVTPGETVRYPPTASGQALAAHIDSITAIGPDAEANYQASLAALRATPSDSVATIVETYRGAAKTLYGDRAWLVETLTELRLPDARGALLEIAEEPLPERIATPDDTFSPRTPEIVIRMTAIRGLGHLASADDRAVEHLLAFTRHEELLLQEQAKQALAIVIALEKDKERLHRLIRLFPGNYQGWLPVMGVSPPAPAR